MDPGEAPGLHIDRSRVHECRRCRLEQCLAAGMYLNGTSPTRIPLLAMIALSAVQSSTRTRIYNAILSADTSAMLVTLELIRQ